jgi:hypothetical protein
MHASCDKRSLDAKQKIMDLMIDCFHKKGDFGKLKPGVREIAQNNFIDDVLLTKISAYVLKLIVEAAIDQGKWSEEVESSIYDIKRVFSPDSNHLVIWGINGKINHAHIIYLLEKGEIEYETDDVTVPGILFQKGERPVYSHYGATLYQQVTRTHYRGGHAGFSFRVAKGLYFRSGGFKGEPVSTTEMKEIDYGDVVITDKNFYFKSPAKSLRIPFTKIISLEPYSDGLGIQTDGARSQPMIIQGVNGWFMYNMISLLVQR